jgi:hypothetical protein
MHDGRRRDVLKAVAVTAASALAGFAPGVDAEDRALRSRPLMTVRINAGPRQMFGTVPHGTRTFVPVSGGDFEGPRLRGRIVPGGGDWLLLRSDGVLELDLRITLETDDQALIYMTFQGLRHGPPDAIEALGRGEVVDPARYYFRTLPRFETSAERYAFLNRIITVGSGEARQAGAILRIEAIL